MIDIHGNLSSANLNLLVIFDAVMQERNVTRAAERLSISQSAVSNALARLRHALNDELFVRKAQGVVPTLRAVELGAPVRDIVERAHRVFSPEHFVPATSERTFTLVLNDHGAATVLPPLADRLRHEAPSIGIRTVPGVSDGLSLLATHDADFVVGAFDDLDDEFVSTILYTDSYICLMRSDHPLAGGKFTLRAFAGADHLLVSAVGEQRGFIDRLLGMRGLTRRVAMVVNNCTIVPMILASCDMIATFSASMARRYTEIHGLCIRPLPISVQDVSVRLIWHERAETSEAHRWMRDLLLDLVSDSDGGGLSPGRTRRGSSR